MSLLRKNWVHTSSFFRHTKSYMIAILGTGLMAMGINLVYEPLSMVTGGFSGIAIIVLRISSGIPVWVTTTALNIPLVIWAWKQQSFSYMKNTLIAAASFSFFLSLIPQIDVVGEDYLMAALVGGVLNGVGLALVFSQGMSTGGTDLLGSLVHPYLAHMSVARLLMIIDGIVVLLGIGIFGLRTGLYAIIAVYVTTKVMDGILEGLKYAKMVFVITDHQETIAKVILHEMDRGVTGLRVRGMYTGKTTGMLLCIVSRKEVIRLTQIVEDKDPTAFVIVSDVREVMGEEFVKRS